MRLIKMVIVPLVFCSLLVGVAGLGDVRKLGRLGGRTLVLYMCTTAGAVTIGLLAAHVIQPGKFVAEKDRAALVASFESAADCKVDDAANAPQLIENILNIVPENPVESLASGQHAADHLLRLHLRHRADHVRTRSGRSRSSPCSIPCSTR